MNEAEVKKQIEQMVMFIKQEAEEKADEIRMSAEEEFNLEKLNLLETEKTRIRKEYERKEAQVEANKKIESSKQLNGQRLKVLECKEKLVRNVFESAKVELKKLAAGPKYADMMADLLCQAMNKMQDANQIVQCREADVKVVEGAMVKAQAKYNMMYGTEAPTLQLDRQHFLPKGAASQEEEDNKDLPTCMGGIVVTSPDGRIVVNNTLDARLKIVDDEQLPAVREMLFD